MFSTGVIKPGQKASLPRMLRTSYWLNPPCPFLFELHKNCKVAILGKVAGLSLRMRCRGRVNCEIACTDAYRQPHSDAPATSYPDLSSWDCGVLTPRALIRLRTSLEAAQNHPVCESLVSCSLSVYVFVIILHMSEHHDLPNMHGY